MTRLPSFVRTPGRLAALGAVLAAVVGGALGAVSAQPAQAYPYTYYASPGDDLNLAFGQLQAGDVLRLRPGTYDAGYVRPVVARGTRSQPITVMADDPNQPPLIRGIVKLFDADYWVLDGLRIQATIPRFEALYLGGGTGWRVIRGEYFGADATNAYDNVAIANDLAGQPPRDFEFSRNCVHGAATTALSNQNHNIYVLFRGDSTYHGAIVRNLIFGHPNGEGIKLGVGGSAGVRGPWGVWVAYNTVVDGGRQILLSGDVRYNSITGNILAISRAPFHADPRTTAIYVNNVGMRINALTHNYFWSESMPRYDPGKMLIDRGDNALRPSPGFVLYGQCYGFRLANPGATAYGRSGSGLFG